MRIAVGVLVLAGCRIGFDVVGDGGGANSDGRGIAPVTHVPPAAWSPGSDTIDITGASTLDTTQLELTA